ncbi:hypothetical protein [Aminobacter sp. BE322]|uniref:hypothetical protein n=1 Tax=unclassified Aminobacter TaxID=2644704 RepID=UPI003D239375
MKTEPSPEVKAILAEFVKKQRAKYGPDWKEKLAAEMAEKAAPVVTALLALRDRAKK